MNGQIYGVSLMKADPILQLDLVDCFKSSSARQLLLVFSSLERVQLYIRKRVTGRASKTRSCEVEPVPMDAGSWQDRLSQSCVTALKTCQISSQPGDDGGAWLTAVAER